MAALHRVEDTAVAGAPRASAKAAAIFIHGRGASPESILAFANALGLKDTLFIAPRARGNTWYPSSFMAPIAENEPWLSSALKLVGALVKRLEDDRFDARRIAIVGFSQGACLTAEFAARNARRYGAVVALTGGLIGPPGTPRNYPGSLAGTPVFIGSSDVDTHVPLERVKETTAVLSKLGGKVDERIYPGMGHTVNGDEADAVSALLRKITAR